MNRNVRSPDDPEFFLNRRNKQHQTGLYIAAKNGHLKVIELLLKYHASVEALSKPSPSSEEWFTPVYPAAL